MINNIIRNEIEWRLKGYTCYVENVITHFDYDNEWIIYVDVVIDFPITEQQKTFSSFYSINAYVPDEIAQEICDDITRSFNFPERYEKESERE